jgi:RHS repeat-associated protein
VQFWDYDPVEKGWYVYGQGSVTTDGRQVVPDKGVVVWTFSGAMFDGSGFTKWIAGWLRSALGIDADPVDLGTGDFAYQKTDLTLPDTMPLTLTRTHIQGDTVSRSFGVGMTSSFDINFFSENQYQEVDLYVPGNAKIHYVRTSAGTGFNDAVFRTTAPGDFYGSTIAWNGAGWSLTRTDGTVLVFGENAPLQSIRDRNGNQVTFVRANGVNGNIMQAVSTNGRWIQFAYDTSNRITSATDNLGRTVVYHYDASGRLSTVTDPQGGLMTYGYDTSNDIASVTDATGTQFVANTYDANGRVKKQVLADSGTYLFTYVLDGGGKVTEADATDPRGFVRKATFDAAGQLISDIQALGQPEQLGVTLTRDPSTELVTGTTDSSGRTTTLGYDAQGNITSATRMAGTAEAQTMTVAYDSASARIAQITDGLAHTTTFTIDANGNVTQVQDPLGHTVTVVPRADGRPTSVTDALGHATTYSYDLGDLSAVTDPLNRTATAFMDGGGRVVATIDPLGDRTTSLYDLMNEVTSVTDPIGAATSFAYDANGNLKSLTDAKGHQTTYAYDNMDRVKSQTDPLSHQTTYTYDAGGILSGFTDAKGQTTILAHDGLGRRSSIGFNAVTVAGHTTFDSTIGYTYDAVGRLKMITDSLAGVSAFGYDDYDRPTSVTTPQGNIRYGYDAGDRLTSETIGSSASLVYQYDDANRLTAILQSGATLVTKSYDAGNRLASIALPDGVVESPSYDSGSQLTGITYASGTTTLGDLSYTYEGAGRRATIGGAWARTGMPQPVASASYDAANRLTSWNGTAVSYDANGQLTSDGTSTYTWDSRSQLTSVAGPGVTASYGYDGIGRRTQATVNGSSTQFLYDGANVAQEITGGSVSASILSGGTDQYFSRTDVGGTRSYLTDALGSTVAMADASGTPQTSYTYEPFGKATSSGATDPNRLQFTGRENDGTGLQYNRARYYSPTLQRFISQDPLGFAGGDVNTSAYTGNSPTNFTDPSGEFFLIPIAIGCAIGGVGSAIGDLAAAKLTGRKLAVGDMLRDAAVGCVTGALGGFLGELGGIVLGRILGVAAEGGDLGLSTAQSWGKVGTLAKHFADHGADFGSSSADEYAAQASGFLQRSQAEGLPTKIDQFGTIRTYDPATNEFGSFNASGTTRTYFAPNPASHGLPTNWDYWLSQPGVGPWTP